MLGDTSGNITGVDPALGVLSDNGGLTKTLGLGANSPAIDAGSPAAPGSGGAACAATDQRGFLRPVGATCDIGAFEQRSSFSLTRILPNTGGSGGSVSAFVAGSGFVQGATVKLTRAGQADIIGAPVQVDAGGSAIATTFDLTGSALGAWDVVVTNPDGGSLVLAGGFSTEAGGVPDLWVNVIGSLRREGPSRLTILYGNRGTVDALAAPLSLSVPEEYLPTRSFAIAPPPPQAGQLRDDWSQVPMTVRRGSAERILQHPAAVAGGPGGLLGVLQIGLTFPADAPESQLLVAIGDPLFAPDLDAAFVSDAVAGAEAYLLNDGVTIPPALVPDLELYVSDQMKQIVEAGRNTFIASLGSQSPVYSMSQLHFDLVFHAAIRARNAQASAAGTTFPWLHEIPRSLVALLSRLGPGEVRAQGQNCPVYDPKTGPPGGPPGELLQRRRRPAVLPSRDSHSTRVQWERVRPVQQPAVPTERRRLQVVGNTHRRIA